MAAEDPLEALLQDPRFPRWLLTDGGVIETLRLGRSPSRTRSGRTLEGFFLRFGLGAIGLLALRLLSVIRVCEWWLRSAHRAPEADRVAGVFLGFGAALEDQLFERFAQECTGAPVIRLDSLDHRTLGRLGRPSLRAVAGRILTISGELPSRLRNAHPEWAASREGLWAGAAARLLARYAYYQQWAAQLPPGAERVVCISLDEAAFGFTEVLAENGQAEVEYWQHGLLTSALVGAPGLTRVRALNGPEGEFLAARCPGARVEVRPLVPPRQSPPWSAAPRLLFASQYDTAGFRRADQAASLQRLFDWAVHLGLEVVVRPHPREEVGFWRRGFPGVRIDQSGGGFAACLDRERPLFVASWWSTVILDSLCQGVLPLVLELAPRQLLPELVFPITQAGLTFPGEQDRATSAVRAPEVYQAELRRRWVWFTGGGESIAPHAAAV